MWRSSATNSGFERSRGWASGTSISSLIDLGWFAMTTTRSARKIASEMLCVTNTTVFELVLPDAQQLLWQYLAGLRVERAEWLVHQAERRQLLS
jgi:hypothetical protein